MKTSYRIDTTTECLLCDSGCVEHINNSKSELSAYARAFLNKEQLKTLITEIKSCSITTRCDVCKKRVSNLINNI